MGIVTAVAVVAAFRVILTVALMCLVGFAVEKLTDWTTGRLGNLLNRHRRRNL
jgi:hypothetical protein